jgi:hypothetical protein
MRVRRLLVLPLLSPLLAVVLVAGLNPGPPVSFRLLTWQSPRAPLGLWLAAAALGGAALSGGAAGLARRQEAGRTLGRTVTSPASEREAWLRDPPEPPWDDTDGGNWSAPPRESVAPARAPGEPAPTLVVPFRVLRGPGASAPREAPPRRESWSTRQPEPVPVAASDDWGDNAAAAEDW